MAFGRPSWVAAALVGPEQATRVTGIHARTVTYGSTAGPFGGMGGAAMSDFDIVALTVRGGDVVVYADDRPLGWVPRAGRQALLDLLAHGQVTARDVQPMSTAPAECVFEPTEPDERADT